MKWNNRNYRPVQAHIINKKREFNFEEALKPYGQKEIPVWQSVVSVNTTPSSSPTPPFDPSSLGGLAVWFDASDSDTLSVSSGRVNSWTSKGSVSYTLTASTSDRRPYFITTGGTGSNDAVLCLSSATTSLRNIMVSDVQAFSTTDGYTFFVAGKNTGTKAANGTFSNPTNFSLHNNISTNTYNGRAVTFTPESFTDYLATGTSVGFTYSTSLNGSSSRLRDMSPYTTIGVSFDYMNIPFTTFSASTSLSNGKMRYSSSSVPPLTYSGKTWNKFTLNGTSLTTESPSSINYEYYEILFYNKTLTQSQVNEVVNYLNTKWLIPSFDFSGMAIINVDNFIGKTGGTANNLNITEPNASSQGLWSSIFGDTDNNILASGLTRFQTTSVSPVGYDWVLLDSNNNIVRDEICQDTSDGYADITLSAGTYTLSGETKYTCIIPSPTPTQTPTPTPTPMYFPTTIYINYTGDTNSYLYGRDDFGNTGFTINGAVTTAFTWTDFVVTNQNNALGIYNSAGAKMSFNRYYADCSTGAPTSSLVDFRTCISEEYGWTNDLGGTPLGYCEVFDIWFDNSCP